MTDFRPIVPFPEAVSKPVLAKACPRLCAANSRKSAAWGLTSCNPSHPEWVLVVLLVTASVAVGTTAIAGEPETRKNLALGKPYSLSPRPNYSYCTDADDQKQLTDGKLTEGYFWTQKGTVGWNRSSYATVTVDLGRVEPISGVSLRTAAGTAGVGWPLAIRVLVSDDGKTYQDVGDLVRLDHKVNGPWPEEYRVRQLVTSELQTRGRFVQFLVMAAPGTAFIFTDEVEVFRGPDALLESEPGGTLVRNLEERLVEIKVAGSIRYRYERDWISIGKAIDEAGLPDGTKTSLREDLDDAYESLLTDESPKHEQFRTVLPFSEGHAELFRIQASLWKALGRSRSDRLGTAHLGATRSIRHRRRTCRVERSTCTRCSASTGLLA